LQHAEKGCCCSIPKEANNSTQTRRPGWETSSSTQTPSDRVKEITGDCGTSTTQFDAGRPMSCPCCCCTFSLLPLHLFTFCCEQTAFLTAYSGLLGTTLTSDAVWRYFFKAVQRPSLLPKDSAEFRGWYDTLPQTHHKDSETYQAWKKANSQMQPKESKAYQG